ncbi:MAG TPA: hypothetical protein P5123_13735 [Spirochaetota bacterium]|nr:hypothetical protein [Spirochaetota bacterium]
MEIKDRELLRQLESIDKLNDEDKDIVKQVLNLIIMKNGFQSLLKHSLSSKEPKVHIL